MKMMIMKTQKMMKIGKMMNTDINETSGATFKYPLTEVETWPMIG